MVPLYVEGGVHLFGVGEAGWVKDDDVELAAFFDQCLRFG